MRIWRAAGISCLLVVVTACGASRAMIRAAAAPIPTPTASPVAASVCAGTGVGSRSAAASIDIGDLNADSVHATLHVGQQLFIGANDCGQYSLPSATAVRPILSEVSRRQRGATPGSEINLAVVYRADSPGQVILEIRCVGMCHSPLTRVTVDVD